MFASIPLTNVRFPFKGKVYLLHHMDTISNSREDNEFFHWQYIYRFFSHISLAISVLETAVIPRFPLVNNSVEKP